ncbi:MAG: helix-turn-helix transcriptional regulator [Thermoguttaceae bacterium]|nr:helix-turn-helix transcriptional regulator [Thermoguttaceae bacterium]
MITSFGKILRKIRIDSGEILKNMADRLEISSAYLSAIENGRRVIPETLVHQLQVAYSLSAEVVQELQKAKDESMMYIRIDLEKSSPLQKNAAIIFQRSFESIDDATALKLIDFFAKSSEQKFD